MNNMKREIKFRGISTKTKKFIFGDLINNPEFETKTAIGFFDSYPGNGVSEAPYNAYKKSAVKSETVGQFTSKKDKNGKEIYEGDVISVNGKYSKIVKFSKHGFSFCLVNIDDLKHAYWKDIEQIPSPNWFEDFERYIEIIGNIHEHPELLENPENNKNKV